MTPRPPGPGLRGAVVLPRAAAPPPAILVHACRIDASPAVRDFLRGVSA